MKKNYRWLVVLALAGSSGAAYGQNCPQWDSNNPDCWQQEEDRRHKRAEDEKRKIEEDYERQRERDAELERERIASEPERRQRARDLAELDAAIQATRIRLLAQPALPPDRNPLLGSWKIASGTVPRGTDDMSQLMGMLENPSGAVCGVVFGEGTTEFLPASWAANDSTGNDSLGAIQYRLDDGRLYALPEKGIPLLGFEIVDANTVSEMRMPDCKLVRVSANDAQARKRAPEICRGTLLDQLGTFRLEQARQVIGNRFEKHSDGKAPDVPGGLRIDARGSDCDDPRIQASLYDFDASGVLQSITYVWDRPPGPAPAAIFTERLTTLSRFHSLPAPKSAGLVEADTSLGRLTLQEVPERSVLLESYRAAK